jgi:hypothetical protein
MVRMNGTGTNRRRASPIATARPEKTTARPALAIVRTIASSRVRAEPSPSRYLHTMNRE